jgi:hypothetical protein
MKYRLVLQWPISSGCDYDALVAIEDALIDELEEGEVDGHDVGVGELNIFIDTNDPEKAFQQISEVLKGHELWGTARIAYREKSASKYTVLQPKNLKDFKVA